MNDEPRQKLRELILEHGRSLCTDPRRCEALLKDYCGTYKREIFVLVAALKNRVADDLLKSSAGMPPAIVMGRLQQRLEDDLALAAEAAQWAVESWALALGFITQPVSVVAKPAHTPLPKSEMPAPAVPVVSRPRAAQAPSPKPAAVAAPAIPVVSPPRTAEILLAGRYRDNGDGTVTDVTTGLQWIRFALGQEWRGDICTGNAKQYPWQAALDTTKVLNQKGGYAGYRDWRLPTKEELLSLVYCSSGRPKTWNDTGRRCQGNYEKPTIFQQAFPNTPSSFFWSGSPHAYYSAGVWGVNFGNGDANSGLKSSDFNARLVRSGQ